jgi:protein phosphatase
VLCSDGLSGQVSDAEIGATAAGLEPREACQFLVDLANLRGGPDNITVVIVRIGTGVAPPTRAPRRSLALPQVPWPFIALVAGVLLAGLAIVLAINKEFGWGVLTMVLALGALVAGTIGLAAQHTDDKRHRFDEPDQPVKPSVHSRKPCQIERALIDRLANAAATLKQRLEERKWDANWAEYQEHYDRGSAFLKENKLVEAFREYCRSMRPLNATLKKLRQKEEVFQPVWDKGP